MMKDTKRKWKSNKFRPEIPDDTCELRKRYLEVLKFSELNRLAFNRKLIEAGLSILASQYAK